MAVATVTALAGADRASAGGAVNIDSCQTLSTPNTTYRLTADISNANDCLIVAADRITIDLQGNSLISPFATDGIGITDREQPHDLIVIKNGTISGYSSGIRLQKSTRVSVIAVTATSNGEGIDLGSQALVKSSTSSSNRGSGIVVGERGQVQQSTANGNGLAGILAGENCLVTMNTANDNGHVNVVVELAFFQNGIMIGRRCTASYNTANGNRLLGVVGVGTGSLLTQNTAINNNTAAVEPKDFAAACPSTLTFNDSTNGFPASYVLNGNGCHTANNN
jgi:hypothetical protein